MNKHKIYLSYSDIEYLSLEYCYRAAELRELLSASSQNVIGFGPAIEDVDFQELAILALLKPFEKLIKELELGQYDYDGEDDDDGRLEVTFSFASVAHAATFKQAIHTHGLG